MRKTFTLILFAGIISTSSAQDPSFAQFFSSPLNINPALTANIKGTWRAISNYRDQWISAHSPYATGTVSMDAKLLTNLVDNYVDENYRLGIGGMFMYDQAQAGAMKGNYASLNLSGNILLAEGSGVEWNGMRIRHNNHVTTDDAEHRIGAGFGVIYGSKRLDYSNFTFGEQFNGGTFTFDPAVPNGESINQTTKPYFSVSAGLLYSFLSSNTNIDLGVAAFHFNKPRQTVLNDNNSYLPIRYVAHGNLETILTDQVVLQTNGIYQYQAGTSYFSIGGAAGYYLSGTDDDNDAVINAGLWYWSNNAVIPYVGFGFRNFQVGASYDITINGLGQAQKKPKTFELSLIIRGNGRPNGVIPSPWK